MSVLAEIRTRYIPANEFHGSKIRATFISGEHKGRQITIGYDYGARDTHKVAAIALCERVNDKFGWTYSSGVSDSTREAPRGFVYNAFSPIMPAWIGEAV